MKKMVAFLSRLVANKYLLYIILGLFCVISLVLFLVFPNNPLTANFLAGSVELIITVTIVDALLSVVEEKDRNSRFVRLNQATADGMQVTLVIAVVRMGELLGYEDGDKDLMMKIQTIKSTELAKMTKRILNSDQFKKLLSRCIKSPRAGELLVNKVAKEMEAILDQQVKSLEMIKPYANPEIEANISDIRVKQTAHLMVIKEMAKMIREVEKKHPGSKESTTKLVWVPVINGDIHGKELSLAGIIQSYFALLTYLVQQTENGTLHFEV